MAMHLQRRQLLRHCLVPPLPLQLDHLRVLVVIAVYETLNLYEEDLRLTMVAVVACEYNYIVYFQKMGEG